MVTLRGRFKGEVDSRWHCVPICDDTRSSIPFRRWFGRLLHRRANVQERTTGWLFLDKKGQRAKFGQHDPAFRALLQEARDKNPKLLPAAVDIEDFSLWRSPRRGAVLETTNQDVSEKVIELINRWRKKEGAKGAEPGLAMRQVYTQVRSALPIMMVYSQAL